MPKPVITLAMAGWSKVMMSKIANQNHAFIQPRRNPAATLPLPPDGRTQSWKPQPSHLSREELRRIVLEIMG